MQKPKILVIEDESETLKFMLDILNESIECIAEGVGSSAKAFELMKDNEYDLVLLDIKLDGLNGLDLLRRIKEKKNLPDVLIVTAWDSQQVAKEAIDAGATDYMPKPVEAEFLIKKVKLLLERQGKYIEKSG